MRSVSVSAALHFRRVAKHIALPVFSCCAYSKQLQGIGDAELDRATLAEGQEERRGIR
jgi:hypothetical protein